VFLLTAWKIAVRELRATPGKFLFVVLAVAVGVAALSGVKGFGYAFKGMLLRNAKQLIAADVQAQMWVVPSPEQVEAVQKLASQYGTLTRAVETVSMAGSSRSSVPQMVSVKAIDPNVYPFYGQLTADPQLPLRTLLANDHSAVVTPELLLRLHLRRGELLRLGGQDYNITGTLLTEPDRLASGFGPGMRVLLSPEGMRRTGLVQFGSRAAQRFLFKLKPGIDLDRLKAQLTETLPHVHLSDYREGSPVVGKAVDNTTTFLSLISLIALIVGSLGVAMAMHSHLQSRLDTIGVIKAIGGRSGQVLTIYLLQTLCLGVAGAVLGVAVGALVQRSFPLLIQRLFSQLPDVPWDWSFSLQGMAVGILSTLLFTLPPLLSLRSVRPSLVFRRNMEEAGSRAKSLGDRLPAIAGSGAILLGFFGIAVWLSGSWRMGLYFVGGLTGSLVLLGIVAAALLATMRRLVRLGNQSLPSTIRHGFANLYRPGNQARAVLVALGVGVMFTLSTYLLQRTVLREVNSEGPGREGNLFLLDIRDAQAISRLINSEPGITGKLETVGYIMGRLLSQNGTATGVLPLPKERKSQLSSVRITTADSLPNTLHVTGGAWWTKSASPQPQMAISEDSAREFHLRVGDQLIFQLAGRRVQSSVVATFRREARAPVRYELVMPNVALAGFPITYYGAVHVDPAQIPRVEMDIFEQFPTVTVMNLADILKRIQEAVDQVAVVIRFLSLFAIGAGVIILSASIAGTRARRLREVAILKTIGATRRRISAIFSMEFTVLGAVAGLVGAVLANLFTRLIAEKFVETSFDFDWSSLLFAMVVTAVLANAAGWLASARILNQKPLEVLRAE
jgi:putative ABC transport system permease protein